MADTLRALTVRQPWAWAIAHGGKDVENRSWPTSYRGLLAIHAGARWDEDGAWDRRVIDAASKDQHPGGYFDPPLKVEFDTGTGRTLRLLSDNRRFVLGAVIAVAELVDVTRGDSSPWAVPGEFHWRLANVRPLDEPVPCKGRLGLWTLPPDVNATVLARNGADICGRSRTGADDV